MAEYYYEFFKMGQYIRVVAIDPITSLEITFSGAKGTPQKELMRLAGLKLSKLIESKYKEAINKRREEEQKLAEEHKKWQDDNNNWLA